MSFIKLCNVIKRFPSRVSSSRGVKLLLDIALSGTTCGFSQKMPFKNASASLPGKVAASEPTRWGIGAIGGERDRVRGLDFGVETLGGDHERDLLYISLHHWNQELEPKQPGLVQPSTHS